MKLRHTKISLPAGAAWLNGLLAHAPDVRGLVLLPQASVGNHEESREAYLASIFQQGGYATLILDLLTRYEDARDPDVRYNVPLLATRILAASDWIEHQPPLQGLAVGVVAGSTASGAAVRAISKAPERFGALVCRAGRPDLAGAGPLRSMLTPVRFVVGTNDRRWSMLHQAFELVTAIKDWTTVDGAAERFVEPGTLDIAGRAALDWLQHHLPLPSRPDEPDESGEEEP